MSHVRIWIHAVWGTKNHAALISDSIKVQLFKHIRENGKSKGLYLDFVNGTQNHVHCLLSLNADLSISKTINLIKGEASHWVNKNLQPAKNFEWADEYFAASVSDSRVSYVREYIRNQEEHHRKVTFDEEYQKFINDPINHAILEREQ
jgi:putative transposase